MKFKFTENSKQINEIHKMFNSDGLIVDNSYQRRAIWTDKDKVRLIETILLHYVVPSIYLWQSKINPDTGETETHIVDGQQRISAIDDFIRGKICLKTDYLMDEDSKKIYGDKKFKDLDSESKASFWNYKLSVIEIDPNAREEHVINMFERLNLTNYNLNQSEKRHAKSGAFHVFATEVSENQFWEVLKVFSGADVKRMNDITYCATIIILMKKGIVDQSKMNDVINSTYEQYRNEYPELNEDKERLEKTMSAILRLQNDITAAFLKRKAQLYSIFSIIFYMQRKGIDLDQGIIDKFIEFVSIYELFINEENSVLELTNEEGEIYDIIRKYKQASSEGINKLSNRTIRFSILKQMMIEDKFSIKNKKSLVEKLRIKKNGNQTFLF